jgi:hypothetical protein
VGARRALPRGTWKLSKQTQNWRHARHHRWHAHKRSAAPFLSSEVRRKYITPDLGTNKQAARLLQPDKPDAGFHPTAQRLAVEQRRRVDGTHGQFDGDRDGDIGHLIRDSTATRTRTHTHRRHTHAGAGAGVTGIGIIDPLWVLARLVFLITKQNKSTNNAQSQSLT